MEPSIFVLTGDPASIRVSGMEWSKFSSATSSAAIDIRAIDSGGFIGDEADLYRQKLNCELPRHLDATSDAWAIVGAAFKVYATALGELQSRMSALAAQASREQSRADAANVAVADATTADARHLTSVEAATHALKPGEALPADTYQVQTAGASSQLSAAHAALQATGDAASLVRSEHSAAIDACVSAVNQASGLRFEEPPGFWGRLRDSAAGWITDNADVLKGISSVLKTISGIAGLLAMIPVLSPIMGPLALATSAGSLLIDTTVKSATGEGSWTSIITDGALMVLPGAGKLLKGTVLSTKVGKAADTAATKALNLAKDSTPGKALAALSNSKVGGVLAAPGKGLDWVNTKVAQGLGHVPGANRLPGVKIGAPLISRDTERAASARDAAGLKPSGRPNRDHAAYVGASKDGTVVVGRARTGVHAEEHAMSQLPDAMMTKAYGWRKNKGTGQVEWKELPVCVKCQSKYLPDQFVSDINADPGGAWGL